MLFYNCLRAPGNQRPDAVSSMHPCSGRNLLSYLMIAGGFIIVFLGARDFWEWRFGQSEIAHDFRPPETASPAKSMDARVPLSVRGESLATLAIPRLNTHLYVVEGDDAGNLRRGPGHLMGSAMPGAPGNCVIAGHRDTHFRVLKDIRKGDLIVLETSTGRFCYRVQSTSVVSPEDVAALRPASDAQLHLITCYPFYYVGPAPKRFVVQAALATTPNPRPLTTASAYSVPVPLAQPAYIRPARSVEKPIRHEFRSRSLPVARSRKTNAVQTARGGHRKMGGWNRVPKNSTASRNYRPTSLP